MRSAHLSFVTMLVMLLAGPAPADEPTYLLFTVSWVDRQDPPARDQARLDEAQRQLDAATEPSERDRLAVELERARADVDRQTGFIVFGWAQGADGRGRPVDGGRSMAALLLGGDTATRRALDGIEAGGHLLVDPRGLKDAFTTEGRRYHRARRVRRLDMPVDEVWGRNGLLPPVPAPPSTPTPSPAVSITFERIKEDPQRPLLRYQLSIDGGAAPANAATLQLWLRVRARTRRGETLGPIPVHVSIDRSSAGGFAMRRSWEIRTAADVDEHATGVELVAWDWD